MYWTFFLKLNKVALFCLVLYLFRFIEKYKCGENKWIKKFFKLRRFWCPAFSKNYFSAGVLSTQRSESANHSISRRLNAKTDLNGFYKVTLDVLEDWRGRETVCDFKNSVGKAHCSVPDVGLLEHARTIYTESAYKLFEERFVYSMACTQKEVSNIGLHIKVFHVTRPIADIFVHVVEYNTEDHSSVCSCGSFVQDGMICLHILRIWNVFGVQFIPHRYIAVRWTKNASFMRLSSSRDVHSSCSKISNTGSDGLSLLWKVQMTRKFSSLINICEFSKVGQEVCEEAFRSASKAVQELAITIPTRVVPSKQINTSSVLVQNPVSNRVVGEWNERKKSKAEVLSNVVKGRRNRKARVSAMKSKKIVQQAAQTILREMSSCTKDDVYFVHPPNGGEKLIPFGVDTSFFGDDFSMPGGNQFSG